MDANPHINAVPLPFDPAFEVREAHEAETLAGLMDTLHGISESTFKHSGHAIRSVHAKSHGLLRGELRVLDGLPPTLAQGIFARPGSWPVVMRLSTVPGDILDDRVSTPRGLAIKVVGVEGERLEGSEGATTQDFVLVNGRSFPAPGAAKFLTSLKLLAPTTDKAPNLKKAVSAVLRGAERVVEAFGGESATLKGLGGHPETHILGETFFSQAPILFGPYMAKVSVLPVSAELAALTNAKLNLNGHPNGLRDAVLDFFKGTAGVWELRVQLCTDLQAMPIEDASVAWPEDISPYIAVARITVPPQVAWSAARSTAVDDGMAFSPWHGVRGHRPIGSVMRVRKAVYEMSAHFRAEHNGRAIVEPVSLDDLPA
ncbi:MAG: catalase family protein [Bacteriovorax sp.]|nr:catalase family protein [Rhizobacter sp.]